MPVATKSASVTPDESKEVINSKLGFYFRRQFIIYGILPILLIVMIVFFTLMEPRFASYDNLVNVVRQLSFIGIITLGQMLYLITGNYDLSNGGNVALSSVVCATIMTSFPLGAGGVGILLACTAALVIGLIVGVVNAVLIAVFKVHSFMATFGMGSITVGIGLLVAGGVPVVGVPSGFVSSFGSSAILGVPFPTVVFIFFIIFAYIFLNRLKVGRQAYAVGGNEVAAFQSGVPTRRVTILVMMIGSVLASVVGILLTARLATGSANIGIQYPLESITAAVIGGIALSGGEGRVSGAVMGALFVVLLGNGMDLIHVQGYVQGILLGTMLILALLVDRIRVRVRANSKVVHT